METTLTRWRMPPLLTKEGARGRSTKHFPTSFRAIVTVVLLSVTSASVPASAHIQVLRGKLLDLVQRSDLVVIGTADKVTPIGTSLVDTTVKIATVLAGTSTAKQLTFRGPTRFAPNERYVFFLNQSATGFVGVQDAGSVFPCTPADDAVYRTTIQSLRRALGSELATRPDAVRAALLPALTATPAPLRYNAALELSALAHQGHPPNAVERTRIEKLLHDPATDPTLAPLLTELIRLAGTPVPSSAAQP